MNKLSKFVVLVSKILKLKSINELSEFTLRLFFCVNLCNDWLYLKHGSSFEPRVKPGPHSRGHSLCALSPRQVFPMNKDTSHFEAEEADDTIWTLTKYDYNCNHIYTDARLLLLLLVGSEWVMGKLTNHREVWTLLLKVHIITLTSPKCHGT